MDHFIDHDNVAGLKYDDGIKSALAEQLLTGLTNGAVGAHQNKRDVLEFRQIDLRRLRRFLGGIRGKPVESGQRQHDFLLLCG